MISIQRRPLLVSAQLRVSHSGHIHLLINNEQSFEEQNIAFWHEVCHLLGITDCEKAESLARAQAERTPDFFLSILKEHE